MSIDWKKRRVQRRDRAVLFEAIKTQPPFCHEDAHSVGFVGPIDIECEAPWREGCFGNVHDNVYDTNEARIVREQWFMVPSVGPDKEATLMMVCQVCLAAGVPRKRVIVRRTSKELAQAQGQFAALAEGGTWP